MELGYQPPKYRWENMDESFQTDLCDPKEQINIEAFCKACEQSEIRSLYNDLSKESNIRKLAQQMNSFEPNLRGIVNEWSIAEDKSYARDGICLDGKTATEYMYQNGCSFTDVVCKTQNAFDHPAKSEWKNIQLSIGGPAFLKSDNLLERVKENQQRQGIDRTFNKWEPNHRFSDLKERQNDNRNFLIQESELDKLSKELKQVISKWDDKLELEGMALLLNKPLPNGEVKFPMIGDDGKIITATTTPKSHLANLEFSQYLKDAKITVKERLLSVEQREKSPDAWQKESALKVGQIGNPLRKKSVREKISLKDLQDTSKQNKRPVRNRETENKDNQKNHKGIDL